MTQAQGSLEERFWAKVEKTETCWLWTGHRSRFGYGRISLRGEVILAHRVAWELAHGPIPPGLWVLHRCDNPPCVRDDHLFLGTQADNTQDMVTKGRQKKGLPPAVVRSIRASYQPGVRGSIAAVARSHGVSKNATRSIIRGLTRSSIT